MVIRLSLALAAISMMLGGCSSPKRGPVTSTEPESAAVPVNFDELLDRTDFKEKIPAPAGLLIDNPFGDVRLRFGGYEHVVEVHAVTQRPDRSKPDFQLSPAISDGVFRIAPQLPAGSLLPVNQRVDLTVFVPKGHATTVRTVRGLIESRGIQADLALSSESGNISLRGTTGLTHAETASGQIEVSFENAPAGSSQRLATTTGMIIAAFADSSNLALDVATSAPIATEFSLQIERQPGAEPNKRAQASVGTPAAHLQIQSKRGEIRLLRRAGFTPVASTIEPARGSKEEG